MAQKKKQTMSREEAIELYNDLQKSMTSIMQGKAPAKTITPKSSFMKAAIGKKAYGVGNSSGKAEASATMPFVDGHSGSVQKDRGMIAAITFLLFCGMLKLGIAFVDYIGVFAPINAEAGMAINPSVKVMTIKDIVPTQQNGLTPEDIRILTQLDQRRVELEERARKISDKEQEFQKRDKEYITKLAELRELTEKLRMERDKDQKRDQSQLDQLSAVYGAMAPQEAARLIEQLDVSIALPLLQKMPDKRMGLILPMMSPEKALIITKLLSGQ